MEAACGSLPNHGGAGMGRVKSGGVIRFLQVPWYGSRSWGLYALAWAATCFLYS
ncbi:MAG: hypothetical protein ACREMA_15335 [Longimicrobiales bacterium]